MWVICFGLYFILKIQVSIGFLHGYYECMG